MKKDSVQDEQATCAVSLIHEDVVLRVQAQLLPQHRREMVAEFFKIMGDPTRISILNALSVEEMCVCDIALLLNMTQSAISHQLKTLRQTRLVSYRREGKVVYYSLNDEHVHGIIAMGLAHVMEKE